MFIHLSAHPFGRAAIVLVGKAMLAMLAVVAAGQAHGREKIVLAAEQAVLEGSQLLQPTAENPDPPRLGGFKGKREKATWTFPCEGGIYRIRIEFRSPYGPKGFSGQAGELPFSGSFPESKEFGFFDAGLTELAAGEQSLRLGGGWGHYEIKSVELLPADPPAPPAPVPAVPVDAQATPEARALLKQLAGFYGKHTLTAQMDAADLKVLQDASDRLPAIFAADLMFQSPSMVERQGPRPKEIEAILAKAAEGHIISLLWHWNAPTGLLDTPSQRWFRGFYAKATSFDFEPALDPAHPDHALLLRDIDAIAESLKRLDAAKVPVLWRPLHECEYGGFWWGAKGPEPFKKLWRLLYERLTQHHQLHNLIWVLTSEDPAWYPGDDQVDIVCVDAYPESSADPLAARWEPLQKRFAGRKMLALGEFPGVANIPLMHRLGIYWAWSGSWKGSLGPAKRSSPEIIRAVYQSDGAITLDELRPEKR